MFPTAPLPDKIGTYKVVRRLSGTGAVEAYLGRSEGPMGFQRDCVLKLMADTSEGSVQFAEELAREAAICSRLTHPNIVRMFDFFEHDRKLVLVLEYSEGITLNQLVEHLADKHKKLSDPAIYHVGHQIAGALAHAHAATDEKGKSTPIIHRSLHPDNILVALDGYVRLTGFGVGKILGRTPDTALGLV
jgi:serine/threonine protein kinase